MSALVDLALARGWSVNSIGCTVAGVTMELRADGKFYPATGTVLDPETAATVRAALTADRARIVAEVLGKLPATAIDAWIATALQAAKVSVLAGGNIGTDSAWRQALATERRRREGPRDPMIATNTITAIEASFHAFHAANPWVYDRLAAMARSLLARGHTRIGIGMLFEVLRWHSLRRRTNDPSSEFQLNNNYRSYYARALMAQEPDLVGVFELRELRSA